MAWGKVTRFLRALSRHRVSRYVEFVDPWQDDLDRDDGWQHTAMHYTPLHGVTPGNHP